MKISNSKSTVTPKVPAPSNPLPTDEGEKPSAKTRGRKKVSYKALYDAEREKREAIERELELLRAQKASGGSQRGRKRRHPLDEAAPEGGFADTIVPDRLPSGDIEYTLRNGREYVNFQTAIGGRATKPDPVFRGVLKDFDGPYRARWNPKSSRWWMTRDAYDALCADLESGEFSQQAELKVTGFLAEFGEPETEAGKDLKAQFLGDE